MAITYSATVRDIVQEAFNLLRQDYSAPTVSTPAVSVDAVSDTSMEWKKARLSLKTAANEVFDAFSWGATYTSEGLDSWSAKMRNALVYTLARELAIPIAGRIEDMKVFASLANDKLVQAMVKTLNDLLASNTDPVLTELLTNFRRDDAGLANAFSVYTQRAANVKATAEIEINMAHGWRTAFDWDASASASHPAYPAWIALCASKLSLACGFDANLANILEQKYLTRLQASRVADLEAAKDAVTDADTKDVLAMVLGSFSASDAKLPRSIGSVTARIEGLKDNARIDVLTAHDWNFACQTDVAGGDACERTDTEYRYVFPYPSRALRLVAVYGHRGKLNEWKVENREILAKEPITRIRYLRDVTDVSRWSPIVRPLFVMRIKALVARTVMNSAQDAAMQEQLYREALADAKLHDARESNTPDDAWGGNHYADMMRGRRVDMARRP